MPPVRPGPPTTGPGKIFRSAGAIPDAPLVSSVSPQGDYTAGGAAVTIIGSNFHNEASGAAPTVLFGSTSATSVVVVDAQTITCVAPAHTPAELVDVSVTIRGQTGTLQGAFLYYEPTIDSVSPAYGTFGGGTQVTIFGFNFNTALTFDVFFGTVIGTNVVVIDSSHIVVTTPAHAVGFVDVIIKLNPSGTEYARLVNGFQFTQLTRGNDIRRQPGITIRDVLNNQPNSCDFSVDGLSNVPVVGEQINIVDEKDGNRLLFAGNVQSVDQAYEELTNQLVWHTHAIDFTWLLNRRRPHGNYTNTSASEIVVDLITRFAPGFSTAFVQTKLALVSVSFDGTQDLVTCLNILAAAIGGGHWYVDYSQVVHFFHVKSNIKPIVPISVGPGTALVASEDGAMPSTESFTAGYYYFRTTFIYSNGIESALGPASNIVALTGFKQITLASIPLGTNPGGGITVTGRRIYYVRGNGQLARGWKINDNTTTSITTFFGAPNTATVIYEGKLQVTITQPPPPPAPPPPVAAPVVTSGSSVGYIFTQGYYVFSVAAIYANGSVSQPSPSSNEVFLGGVNGPAFTFLPIFPSINGVNPIAYRVYVTLTRATNFSGAGGTAAQGQALSIANLPYSGTTSPPATGITAPKIDLGDKPKQNPNGTKPTFTWPNPDGPYLEGFNLPDDITDTNPLLLREPAFTQTIDTSQIRNRVTVLGAATSTTADAKAGDTEIAVADVSIFQETGGTITVDGHVVDYFSPSGFTPGQGSLFLSSGIPKDVAEGSPIRLYMQADDFDSQVAVGRVELDVNGQPTDGIHEFVISDTSLLYPQQLYVRVNAELELFSRPIVTVHYATRDPKTRSGALVNINLSNPPCKGSFLIQDVTIDQIHDESDQLMPRYIVTASSVKFELNDLLLQILGGQSTNAGLGGMIATAVNNGAGVDSFDPTLKRTSWGHVFSGAAAAGSWEIAGVNGSPALTGAGASVSYDGAAGVPTVGGLTDKSWVTLTTSSSVNAVAGLQGSAGPCQLIEYNFDLFLEIYTGPIITRCCIWLGLNDVAAVPTQDIGTNQSILAIRYSTGATDPADNGWTLFSQGAGSGNPRTSKAIPGGNIVAPNTYYSFHLVTSGGPLSSNMIVSANVNGGDFASIAASDVGAAKLPIAAGVSGQVLKLVWGVTTFDGVAKKISFRKFSVSGN